MAASRLSMLRPTGGEQKLASPDAVTRRELYFFELYRLFEAATFTALCYSEWVRTHVGVLPSTTARVAALGYLLGAGALFVLGRRNRRSDVRMQVLFGLTLDLLAAMTALTRMQGLANGVATLLLVNVSSGALLLPPRLAYFFAGISAISVFAAFGFAAPATGEGRYWTEGAMFAATYIAVTVLCQMLRREVSESQERVERQEIDLANLTQINDLIIRRMRTGVLVIDADNHVHQVNESAWHLLGNPSPSRRELGDVAPEIARRLFHWRAGGKGDTTPVMLAEGVPEVIPRFVRLGPSVEGNVLVFLDDISIMTRQAEQLTLSSLGRLSASVAHEVRNPLAAISYSAQLLSESEDLSEPDLRLVDIIRAQCTRVNSIVENILQLSRRERSRPEQLELSAWVNMFVEEYRTTNPLDRDEVKAVAPHRVHAVVDPSQLHQVVWNLVQNARRYGRLPDEPARITVLARKLGEPGPPVIEIVDRGPGIPKKVAEQIFDPFFTTHEHGTGLGLYIARQLCEANQATLEYVPVAGGGSCFRLVLSPPTAAGGPAQAARARTATR
ncbi:MAG TPA: ATP-binding protein [Xanthomonadales bacterium]|nr:ATP-binding protein [Xanthomonadales bacterium]